MALVLESTTRCPPLALPLSLYTLPPSFTMGPPSSTLSGPEPARSRRGGWGGRAGGVREEARNVWNVEGGGPEVLLLYPGLLYCTVPLTVLYCTVGQYCTVGKYGYSTELYQGPKFSFRPTQHTLWFEVLPS